MNLFSKVHNLSMGKRLNSIWQNSLKSFSAYYYAGKQSDILQILKLTKKKILLQLTKY
jgi:hypothetical protein